MKITNQNVSFSARFDNRVKEDILSKKDLDLIKEEVSKMGNKEDVVVLSHKKNNIIVKKTIVFDYFQMSFISKDGKQVYISEKQTSGRTKEGITYAIKSNIAELKEKLGIFKIF